MQRVAYIIAGLFLAANAVWVLITLVAEGKLLTLALLLAPVLSALALGAMLVIRNIKKDPEPEPEVATDESEVEREIP